MQAAEQSSTALDYAGFWLRVIAGLIDLLIVFLVSIMIIMPLKQHMGELEFYLFSGGFELLSTWIYFAVFESSGKQASFGKQAVGLRVVSVEGDRITFLRATGRYFSKILSGVILGIGFLMAAFTPKRQALHDLIANTAVIRIELE